LLAEGRVSGTDWVRSALGAEIVGGTGIPTVDSVVRVDGTIEVGLCSEHKVTIDENGKVTYIGERMPTITKKKAILSSYLLDEIRRLKLLAAEYAGTEAGIAFNREIQFLENQLKLMGYNPNGPLEPIWIDIIVIGDIRAEQPNINIVSEDGSLVGTGKLSASERTPLIEIINNSPYYLELGSLIIPEKEGGLIFF